MTQQFFETLNQSLESENLVNEWPLGTNIGYSETIRTHSNSGDKIIIVYRNEEGRYERPTHYSL